jgi:DNA mismatch repair protein MutL
MIRVLPPEIASQIAAGEVAERPASVVKELLENSLDAGATRCDIEIEGGGVLRLVVSDDGHGMNEADARLSLERHATSKLSAIADLTRVSSYGFRGEALPSIASVSRFSLRTRERASDSGVEVLVEGTGPQQVRAVGMSVGTRVEVNDLFFNVPARRKFLRSSGTESGHVTEVVENAALARPDVTFTLVRDGRKVREHLRVSSREERIRALFAEEALTACGGERGPLRVEAYLSRPEQARTGAAGLKLLVNSRPVRDRALAATVAHAYGSVLERGRYPRGAIFLELPPELVDVNVHPQKAEVRFADPRAVSDALHGILGRALGAAFSLPPRATARSFASAAAAMPAAAPRAESAQRSVPFEASASSPNALRSVAAEERAALVEATKPQPLASEDHAGPGDAAAFAGGEPPALPPVFAFRDSGKAPIVPNPNVSWASLGFVAQLRQTYLLCEGTDGIYLLDQHAAAERVTFTRLRRQYQSRAVPSQSLLFPALVEVSEAEAELVEARNKELSEVGLDVRVRGAGTLSIHGVPKLLASASPERLLRDLLAEVTKKGERAFSDAIDLALATMACHGSIRAGDTLAASEAKALLVALDTADFAGHCPHGRPVVSFIAWAELERKVGRR